MRISVKSYNKMSTEEINIYIAENLFGISCSAAPPFSSDLKACMQAELKLHPKMRKAYELNILQLYKKHRATVFDLLHTPPHIRAVALVKTLQEEMQRLNTQ